MCHITYDTGIDDTLGPQVYSTDPDGSFTSWKAVCLGQNSDKVEESLIALIEDNQGLNGVNVSMALRILNEQVIKKHFSHTIDQTIDQHSSDEDRSSNDEWDIEVGTEPIFPICYHFISFNYLIIILW